MKFRESRLDGSGRVVILILVVAALVIIGAIIAKVMRGHPLV